MGQREVAIGLKVKCWQRDRFAVIGFLPEGSSGVAPCTPGGPRVGLCGSRRHRMGTVRLLRSFGAALELLARPTSPLASSIKKQGTTWVEHAIWSFAKLSLGPRPRFADQDLPSTTEKRSFLTIATMSSAMSFPILMSRSSASHASCPIMSRVSGSSVVRSMPLY
jgi:hypothetical protein